MGAELTRVVALTGSLTRWDGLHAEMEHVALRGSLVQVAPLAGSFTRWDGLHAEMTETWPPPDSSGGRVVVEDLGAWRPRVRAMRGTPDPWLAWSPVAFGAFYGGRPASPFEVVLFAEGDWAEPPQYAAGPSRAIKDAEARTIDTIRVTDALGAIRDLYVYYRDDVGPEPQALVVPIGTDGVAGVYIRGALALSASGGTGPYTWELTVNRSGSTITPGGDYVAGEHLGIDRVRVTDALGAIAYAQLEVVAVPMLARMVMDPAEVPFQCNFYGYRHLPAAHLLAEGGTGPYTFTLHDNQTGGRILPARSLPAAGPSSRVTIGFREGQFGFVDFSRWNFVPRLRLPDGHYLDAEVELFPVWNGSIEVVLPHPEDVGLWDSQLVLEVELTPANGGETVFIEALFESPTESVYAAAR